MKWICEAVMGEKTNAKTGRQLTYLMIWSRGVLDLPDRASNENVSCIFPDWKQDNINYGRTYNKI
jgi:hypothetical protein